VASELIVWVLVAILVLWGIGLLARRVSLWLTLRKVQKLREMIATGTPNNDLGQEKHDEYLKLIELVKFKCHWAENYIAEGKTERFEKTIITCLTHADEIEDDYYKSIAMNFVAQLLRKAGAIDRAMGVEATMPVRPGDLVMP
jgi:hypothetical protein